MSKQIKTLASGIAALGRGEDKMLVHMTPREVEGLQKLAVASGGSLTINPHTGLLEAGWLSSLLPIVAGGVATVLSGGTLAPIVAGALAGGVGSKIEGEDPLIGALMGGVGGFGGGALGNLAMNAGKAGTASAVNAGLTEASKAAASGAAQSTGAAAGQNIISGAVNPLGTQMAQAGMQNAVQPIAAQQAAQAAGSQIPAALASPGQLFGKDAAMAGIKGLVNQPGRAAAVQAFKAMPQSQQLGALYAGTTGIGALSDAVSSPSSGGGGKKQKTEYYHSQPVKVDPVTGQTTFGPGYWSREYDYKNMGMYDPNNVIPDVPYYKKAGNAYMADGGSVVSGLASLPEWSGLGMLGRFIQGPGDGVSDHIPAKIDNQQPAALSDGEFVIDAQTVSKLGNGSSQAGAQRLYNMMDRVHRARTAPGQGINPNKFLPA